MPEITSREYQLVRRPVGTPTAADFKVFSRSLAEPAAGQIRVRNRFLSVDPYMRGRMVDARSYSAPFALEAPLDGGAIGVVEASAHPGFAVGDTVLSMQGWREGFLSDGKGVTKIDPGLAPPQAFLGVLGMPGMTAWVGLFVIGGLKEGETVLVSGAAGAVGMVVCQIAKAKGCRVVGVVGSDEKARWLEREAGVDATINYRTAPSLRKAIAAAAPEDYHLVFENVGGEQLDAAISCTRDFGRIVLCGLISQYNATEAPTGLRNTRDILTRRLTVRGFIVSDHGDRRGEFLRDMSGWIKAGRMKWTETIVDGFDRMPEAFLGLFTGANVGKMLVRLD